ncbi:glycoside hydrolase family 88 protein [Bacillus sp. PAMC26568]|nr:glycoside hydrolase family 88 protein [Bacillus sp. PAMC26568]
MELFLLIIILICLIIILFDVVPAFHTWVQRIHIGRYTNFYEWNQAISKKGIKWISKTPKIKVTDQTRLVLIDMLKGNYSKDAIQHWQEAALLLGFSEDTDSKNDLVKRKAIIQYLNQKFNSDESWIKKPQYVDAAILSYAVMKLDFIGSDKYKPAYDETLNLILSHVGEDGTVAYRKSMMKYRYVDTIGFICPFLIKYGIKYKNDECIKLAVKQLQIFGEFGIMNTYKLPFHVYNIENKVPLGLMGWGRGLGWYAIGLIDAWDELPMDHFLKPQLEVQIVSFAREALKYQNSNGSWTWTVTRTETRADSSATATLGWFMRKASKIDLVSEECSVSAEKAISYLMKVTRKNGAVDYSQGDTKDIGVYSTLFDILPFTQGFAIRLVNSYKSKVKIGGDSY